MLGGVAPHPQLGAAPADKWGRGSPPMFVLRAVSVSCEEHLVSKAARNPAEVVFGGARLCLSVAGLGLPGAASVAFADSGMFRGARADASVCSGFSHQTLTCSFLSPC